MRIEKITNADCGGDKGQPFILGKARRIIEGDHITLIAVGGILSEVLIAAKELEKKSIKCRVVSCHTIKPIDSKEIIDAALNTGGIITIEENNLMGGLGSAVAEVCMDAGIQPRKFTRIGLADQYSAIVGNQDFLRSYYSIDSKTIVKKVLE